MAKLLNLNGILPLFLTLFSSRIDYFSQVRENSVLRHYNRKRLLSTHTTKEDFKMRLIYAENGVQHQLTQIEKDLFLKEELQSTKAALLLNYFSLEQNQTKEVVAEVEEEIENQNESDQNIEQAETAQSEPIQSLQEIELNQPLVFEDDKITLPVQNYLTSLNVEMVGNLVDVTSHLTLAFHKDRDQFARDIWGLLDSQISQADLKIIFTDVLEKKVKEEIKTITKIKVCSGTNKEKVKPATELEANIFSAYNVKNEPFSILGYKEQTQEYFGCFHLDSVNFIFIFKQLNELNKLQINLFKSFAQLFNLKVQEQRSLLKKKKTETRSKIQNLPSVEKDVKIADAPITETIQ